MAKLKYETKGGNVSSGETFAQLIEYLRLAAEASYTLGHYYKAQDDNMKGQGFLAVGQMLEYTVKNVTKLAVKRGMH